MVFVVLLETQIVFMLHFLFRTLHFLCCVVTPALSVHDVWVVLCCQGELNVGFACCRWHYVRMMHGDDSIWESFPRSLESRSGARRYITAFWTPFQESRLNPLQEHVLRTCSLLVILPPPPGSRPLPGGPPNDLSEINFSAWVELVQDVAAGLLALPPGMHDCLFPEVTNLLLHFEVATQVMSCCQCYLPGPHCRCLGMLGNAPSMAPVTTMALAPTWSQADRRVPSSGIVTSPVTTTTLSTATQSATRVPPPGLPPPTGDHRYNLPQPGLPTPQLLMLPPQVEYPTLP